MLNALLNLVFPIRCSHCERVLPSHSPLCLPCFLELPQTGWGLDTSNEMFRKLQKLATIDAAFAMWFYHHNAKSASLIRAIKYKGMQQYGVFVADKIWKSIGNQIISFGFKGIVPVPLHPKKQKKRGYNQLDVFVQYLSSFSKIPVFHNAIRVRKFKKSQTTLHSLERFRNRKQLYEPADELSPGKYLLVDDVITTGATIAACCEALQKNQGVSISVLSFGYSI